jgi:nitrogen-specific signal transduction histidine kinase
MADVESVLVSHADFACWLVDSLRCGVIAVDAGGALRTLNADAQRILGAPSGSAEQSLGVDCRKALVTQPRVAQLLLDALDGQVEHTRAELVLASCGDGPPRTIGFSLAPVREPQGTVCGAALFFRDISAFERMDEQVRLRDRLAALGEMAAGMAHEIRNPVAAMQVLADLLERRIGGQAEARSLLAELSSELRAVERVLGQGLDFVRAAPLLCKPLDVVPLLERALERARARTDFFGMIERDFEPSLPPLSGDPDQIQSVVTDLLVNAMQAMAAASVRERARLRLRLRSRPAEPTRRPYRLPDPAEGLSPTATQASVLPGEGAGRELVLSVADNGPGVPPELRSRIFYPFFTTREQGSGLGLANAQKIVAGHGGRIDVEEGEDGGAVFHVCLPLSADGMDGSHG